MIRPLRFALALSFIFCALPAAAEGPADPDLQQLFAPAGSAGPVADAVCRTQSYRYCNAVECCQGICLICTDIGGGFIEAQVCEGVCYSRQV